MLILLLSAFLTGCSLKEYSPIYISNDIGKVEASHYIVDLDLSEKTKDEIKKGEDTIVIEKKYSFNEITTQKEEKRILEVGESQLELSMSELGYYIVQAKEVKNSKDVLQTLTFKRKGD